MKCKIADSWYHVPSLKEARAGLQLDRFIMSPIRQTLTQERSHPNHWFNRAADLRATAGAAWFAMKNDSEFKVAQSLGLGSGYSMSLACWHVYHMLCGLSIEVISKAVLAQRGQKIPKIHDLNLLVPLTGVDPSAEEKALLKFYTASIVWAGRYPVPSNCSDEMLEQFYQDADDVLIKPGPKMGSMQLLVSSESTDWEHFHKLWGKVAGEYDHML